jgi:hypothetical protein
VALLGIAAGLVYTYPLVRNLTTAIPYTYGAPSANTIAGLVPGDHLQFYYFLTLTEDMASGRIAPFTDPYEFSAPQPSSKRSFFFVPFSLLFVILSPLGGATAYNLLALLSFPATALSVFVLAGRLGLGRAPALMAAVAVTVFPNRVANVAGGHPSGFVLFLLPLTFYFLERAWYERSRGVAAAAGITVVTTSVNEPHFVYFLGGLLPLWLIARLWRESTSRPSSLVAVLAVLGVAAAGPAIALGAYGHRYGAGWGWAGSPALFVVVWLGLFVVWRLTAELRARAEDPAWWSEAVSFLPLAGLGIYAVPLASHAKHLGAIVAGAVMIALLVAKRPLWRAVYRLSRESRQLREVAVVFLPLALAFVVTASVVIYVKRTSIDLSPAALAGPRPDVQLFSPEPQDLLRRTNLVLTHQVYLGAILVPLALCSLATPAGCALGAIAALSALLSVGVGAPSWLPLYSVAHEVIPFFRLIRQPAKFFAIVMVALSLCAGFGVQWLTQRRAKSWCATVAGIALVLILFDFSSTLPLGLSRLATSNRAYDVVKEKGRGSNLLELPIWPGDSAFSSVYEYWTLRTKVATINGYNPSEPREYVERIFRPLESMNVGELSEAQYDLLGALGVRFVTLHGDVYERNISPFSYRFVLERMRRDPNLGEIAADEGVYLFERRGGSYRPWDSRLVWPIGVFFKATHLNLGSGRVVADPTASGGAFVRGRGGEARDTPVVFGPYRSFPIGSYRVLFRARGRGTLEVAAAKGTKILASREVDSSEFQKLPLEIRIDRDGTLEFRGWAAPNADLDIDWILVEDLDALASHGAQRFEAEDLTALYGMDRESKDASGGAYAAMLYVPPGTVVRDGPYRLYEPGRIHCRVRSRGDPFALRAERPDGRHPFREFRVPAHSAWQIDEFDFDLPEETPLCTRLVSVGGESDVDFVELEAR